MNEIIDFLRLLGRGWYFVMAVAVLAGLVAMLTAPGVGSYRTEAVVGVDPTTDAANARLDFVRNLQAASENRVVLERLAEGVDRDVDEIRDALTVRRLDDSQLTRILYEEDVDDAATAVAVVQGFLPAASIFLDTGQRGRDTIALLEELEQEAVAELGQADTAVEEAVEENGGLAPDVDLSALQERATNIRLDRFVAQAQEDDEADGELAAEQALINDRVEEVAVAAARYEDLVTEAEQRRRRLAEIEGRLLTERAAAAAQSTDPTVEIVRVAVEQPARVATARRVLTAMLVAVAAAIVLLLARAGLLGRLLGRRERRDLLAERSTADDAGSAGSAAAEQDESRDGDDHDENVRPSPVAGAADDVEHSSVNGSAQRVDINAADEEELRSLPGVGRVLAARIVSHRSRLGGFDHPDQLREVDGISGATWDQLRPLVHVPDQQPVSP